MKRRGVSTSRRGAFRTTSDPCPGPRLPTLIIVGEEDPATPVSAAREMNGAIKGSKLVIIPQSAHIVTIEQPAALNRALGDFLVSF